MNFNRKYKQLLNIERRLDKINPPNIDTFQLNYIRKCYYEVLKDIVDIESFPEHIQKIIGKIHERIFNLIL